MIVAEGFVGVVGVWWRGGVGLVSEERLSGGSSPPRTLSGACGVYLLEAAAVVPAGTLADSTSERPSAEGAAVAL